MGLVLQPDGPGTTIVLRDGFQGLPSAPRGSSALVGQFPSGPVTHAALAQSPEEARLFSGEAEDQFEASLALSDLYSEDAPPVLLARVTDGLEIQSVAPLWDRKPNRGFLLRTGTGRLPLATGKAHNGGRWGGSKRVFVGKVATIATALTSTTLTTAVTVLEDLWVDAELFLEGDTASPYIIDSVTTAGVITIKGEFSQAAQDADGLGAIDGRYRILLAGPKELSIVIGPDNVASSRFAVSAVRKFSARGDFEAVSNYVQLGLSTDDDRPWTQVIPEAENDGRYQIAISTTYEGATVEEKLPANFCETPTLVSGATLTFSLYRWIAGATNTGNAFIDTVTALDATQTEPHQVQLDFTAATTATVTVIWYDGSTQILPMALTLATVYDSGHPQLTSILARAGTTPMVTGDRLTIRVEALPHDLSEREAFLYPVAVATDGNPNIKLRIVSNTINTVTVRSDLDLDDFDTLAMEDPTILGTADISAASFAGGETVILTLEGASVTFTFSGPVSGGTAIVAALNALDSNDFFVFSLTATNRLQIVPRISSGGASTITVGAGTANATLGLTTGQTDTGVDGRPFRIEARFPMWGGYDGVAPTDARYLIALDLSDHLFVRYLNTNLGLVRVATPGVTSTSVKEAAEPLVRKLGWMYIAEFATSLYDLSSPGESAVSDMIDNEAESDHVEHYFPSHAKFLNVAKTKLVVRSISGLTMGIRSRLANVGVDGERGLHIAAANNNEQGQLSPRVQGLPDGIGRWTPPVGLLNDHGIVPLLWEGPNLYAFGNRIFSKGRTPKGERYTITERAVFYHIARDLFVTTRPFIFKSISARRLGDVLKSLREKMRQFYADGWFSDVFGTGFEDQVQVAVPTSLNPPEELLEGRVSATVSFIPRPALEKLIIYISPTELSTEG